MGRNRKMEREYRVMHEEIEAFEAEGYVRAHALAARLAEKYPDNVGPNWVNRYYQESDAVRVGRVVLLTPAECERLEKVASEWRYNRRHNPLRPVEKRPTGYPVHRQPGKARKRVLKATGPKPEPPKPEPPKPEPPKPEPPKPEPPKPEPNGDPALRPAEGRGRRLKGRDPVLLINGYRIPMAALGVEADVAVVEGLKPGVEPLELSVRFVNVRLDPEAIAMLDRVTEGLERARQHEGDSRQTMFVDAQNRRYRVRKGHLGGLIVSVASTLMRLASDRLPDK